MKLENWLEEHELDELRNVGFIGLILSWLLLEKAQDLNMLLWCIKWAKGDADNWEVWYKENKEIDGVYGMRCKIEWAAEECKAWDFINLYNNEKYFWLPEIKK